MGLSIWNLYEASLLVINAIAILHEERFLAKSMLMSCLVFECFHHESLSRMSQTVGWGRNQVLMNQNQGFGQMPPEPGLKANLMNLIHSIRTVMRSEYPFSILIHA